MINDVGIGIVVGVMGAVGFIGLIKFINWCLGVRERINQLDVDLELQAQRFDKKCLELNNKFESYTTHDALISQGEATLTALTDLNNRVTKLENPEKEVGETPDDN